MEKYFRPFLSAYTKNYSSQNILISLIEEWRENLDNNFVVGAVLTNLPKAFGFMQHILFIGNLPAYNFSDASLSYIYSSLTNRRQCVPYKQHTQSARDYNFGCSTEIHFDADSFQPVNKLPFLFCGSTISL